MPGKQAKILVPASVEQMLDHVGSYRHPERARAIILLSVKAGLRAGEIAGLTWDMVLTSQGRVGDTIHVENRIAKMQSGRRIPINPQLRGALIKLHRQSAPSGPIIRSRRRGKHMQAGSIVHFFMKLYRELNLKGCSSHSGRRTFATLGARRLHEAGGSLIDLRDLLGHRSIQTTQTYLAGDSHAQRRLVQLL